MKWVLKERGTERERNEFQFKSWWNGTELVPKFCKWNGTELVPKKLERSTRLEKTREKTKYCEPDFVRAKGNSSASKVVTIVTHLLLMDT